MKSLHKLIARVLLIATAGCASFERPPAPAVEAEAAKEKAVTAKAPEPQLEARKTEPAPPPAAPPAVESPAASPDAASVPDAKVEAPGVKAPAKAPAEPAPKKETAAPAPAKPPAAPPLDLNALEKRLKDTEAIGVFTKLTLKNQVDDLLGRFEAHYDGTNKASLAELRQPFDLLIMKVLSLLQDRDAALAGAIATSREAMWAILADPAKFRNLLNQNRS